MHLHNTGMISKDNSAIAGQATAFACPESELNSSFASKVAQRAAQIIVDGDHLRLQQLAMGQQHPQFLTA
jgi:hypothetical protein